MIEQHQNVVIVIAKCVRDKRKYCIRFEERMKNQWYGTWSFPIKESASREEHYDKHMITGSVTFDHAYPGCPFCGSKYISQCGKCHNTACWDGTNQVICPWCNTSIIIEGNIKQIGASDDR